MSEIAGDRAVREHLTKVLTSKELEGSERLCRFLRFIVEARLKGEQVKEYLIGKEVFDRNGDYDPRLDPIVRVEARRLRKKLDEYYAGAGASDEVRFELPKGSYVPEFRLTAAATPIAEAPRGRKWIAVACVAVLAVGAAAIWGVWKYAARPAAGQQLIAVVPARWIWTSEDFPAIRHDEDVAERIAAALANRHKQPVVSWPAMQRYRDRLVTVREMSQQLGAARILVVAVRVEASGFRLTTYLIDPKLDRKLKVTDKENLTLSTASDREQAASVIAAEFAETGQRVGPD